MERTQRNFSGLVLVMTMVIMVLSSLMMVCGSMLVILLPPLPVASASSSSSSSGASLRLQSHSAKIAKSKSIVEDYLGHIVEPSILRNHRALFEQETGPKRRKLNDFVVIMSPSNSPLSDTDASTSRDIVEQVVKTFLTTYPSWPEGTSIRSVGLVGVKGNEYNSDFRSIQLTLGGLIYFTDTSLDIPDEDSILRTVTKGLMDQDRLLSEMKPTFQFLQSIQVVSTRAMHDVASLTTPTASPTSETDGYAGYDGTDTDVGADGEDGNNAVDAEPRGDFETADPASPPNIGTLVGSVAGGIAFLILLTGISLIVTRRRRQRFRQTSSVPSPRMSMSGSSVAGSELIGISIIKDESVQGDRQYSSSYIEDDNTFNDSQTDSESPDYPKRLNVEYDSPREYMPQANPEMDPPVLGIEKLFAAATTVPSRMLSHDTCGGRGAEDDSSEPFSDLLEPHDPGDELRHLEFSFDSGSSATGGTSIDPRLLPVPRQQTMESFEHQKRNYNLKKDMMISPLEANYNHPHPQNVHNYRNEPFSALTPTDISARTLAQSQVVTDLSASTLGASPGYSTPRKGDSPSENDQDISGARISSKTPTTPDTIGTEEDIIDYNKKVSDLDNNDDDDPYWSNNGMLSMIGAVWGTAARIRSKDKKGNDGAGRSIVGPDGGRRGRTPSSGGYQSEAETSYEADDLWDPDDMSMSTDDKSGDGLFHASVENRDEQSLLHHSLRNESYKMQRLRTPTSDLSGARHGGPLPGSEVAKTTIDGSTNKKSMSFSTIFDRRRARANDRGSTTSINSDGSAATTSMVANTSRSTGSPTRPSKGAISVTSNLNLVSPQTVSSSRWGAIPLTQPTMLPQETIKPASAPSSSNANIRSQHDNRRRPMREGNVESDELSEDEENAIV